MKERNTQNRKCQLNFQQLGPNITKKFIPKMYTNFGSHFLKIIPMPMG